MLGGKRHRINERAIRLGYGIDERESNGVCLKLIDFGSLGDFQSLATIHSTQALRFFPCSRSIVHRLFFPIPIIFVVKMASIWINGAFLFFSALKDTREQRVDTQFIILANGQLMGNRVLKATFD